MPTDTKLEAGVLEKLGDKFNNFIEGSLGFVTRLFGSANERMVKSVGYIRPKNAEKHTVIAGSTLDPAVATVHARVKHQFDPAGRLNPGLVVG